MESHKFTNDIPIDLARRAYVGTSFVPEKRANQEQSDYAETLASDYQSLLKLIAHKPEMKAVLDSEFSRYRDGYRARTLKSLISRSRCVSTMIAGPSNFPARQMNKRAEVGHKRLTELVEFRSRALDAIRKMLCPELRPIMSGDGDAVQRLRQDISAAEAWADEAKAINAAHTAFLKDPASLDASPLSEVRKNLIREYKPTYSWTPHPVAPFTFTNKSANLRRMKKRLVQLEASKSKPDSEAQGANARIEDSPADNRVRLFFTGKPDAEIRNRLKSNGFRWSPTLGCWQAYRNQRAMECAQQEAG